MAKRVSETVTNSSSNSQSQSTSQSQQQSQGQSQSTTQNVVNDGLLDRILAGLQNVGYTGKSEEELREIAANRYNPIYNAETEAARQKQQATDLGLQQQIESLLAGGERQLNQQNAAYDQSRANIETGALARGMGRSSYTMSTLNKNDQARAAALDQIMRDLNMQQGQLEAQRTQSSQQLAETLGRLETDKQTQILNQLQDLLDSEYQKQQSATQQQNSNWLTALEMAMGQQTTGTQSSLTQGSASEQTNSTSNTSQTSTTTSGSGGSSGGSGGGKKQDSWDDLLDLILGDTGNSEPERKPERGSIGGGPGGRYNATR